MWGFDAIDALAWFEQDLGKMVMARPSHAPEPDPQWRVRLSWPKCLQCGTDVDVSKRGRYCGLCPACNRAASWSDRQWFRSMIDRWRKWSITRYREAELFIAEPDPWQVTLYGLGKLMLGFSTTLGMEGQERCGLDEHLGMPASAILSACRGETELPAEARAKLVACGAWLVELWADQDDDADDPEVAT